MGIDNAPEILDQGIQKIEEIKTAKEQRCRYSKIY